MFIAFRGACVDQQNKNNKQQIKKCWWALQTVQRLTGIILIFPLCFDFILCVCGGRRHTNC